MLPYYPATVLGLCQALRLQAQLHVVTCAAGVWGWVGGIGSFVPAHANSNQLTAAIASEIQSAVSI